MNLENISNQIKDKGFILIKNYLNIEETQSIKENITPLYNNKIGKNNGVIFYNGKRILINHIKNMKVNLFTKSLSLIYSKHNNEFKKVSKKILAKSYLRRIDSYISPIDTNPVINWHNDTSYSGSANVTKGYHHPDFFKLRFFLYLTDVEFKNGALAYLPYSHKVTSFVTQLIYEKIIDYQPHSTFNEILEILESRNIVKLFNSKNNPLILEEFKKNVEKIMSNNDTKDFDNEAKAGSLVIFDDRGFHRGSSCEKTKRHVVRFIYSSKEIENKKLFNY